MSCRTKEKAGVITRLCTPETGANGLPLKVHCERHNVTDTPVTFCYCDKDNCNHNCAAVKCESAPLAKKYNFRQLVSMFNSKKESPILTNPYLQHCEAKCNAGGSLDKTTKHQAEEGDGTPSKGNVQGDESTPKVSEGEGDGKHLTRMAVEMEKHLNKMKGKETAKHRSKMAQVMEKHLNKMEGKETEK